MIDKDKGASYRHLQANSHLPAPLSAHDPDNL